MANRIILASVSKNDIEVFLAPHLNNSWPFEIVFHDPTQGNDELIALANKISSQILLTAWGTKPLPIDLPSKAPSLKYLCHITGAVSKFLPRTILEQGILLTNWGNSIARTIAEHCLLQVLAASRRIAKCQFLLHFKAQWRPADLEFYTLFEKRVGLHGFGAIARELVPLLKPFNCKISTYSPSVPDEMLANFGVKRAQTLEELFSQNDVIVDLAPLTPKTRGIVTEELLRMIPKGGVFVNSGRGAVIDEVALAKIAREGALQLALDVFEKEPLPLDSPLRGCENVLLTPHTAGPTIDERKMCGLHALKNAAAFFEGRPLSGVVGLDEYDRMT
jgi:phosphoglycerate dehydrogenase-like enzyme